MTNELQILIESLKKKIGIMDNILLASKEQEKLANSTEFDSEHFDELFDQKDVLLKEMGELDQGFDATFSRIRDELLDNKEKYRDEILQLQQLIRTTVDRGAEIAATESRTKDSLTNVMKRQKQDLAKRKVSSKTVMDYYKTSSQLNHVEPFFMDQKK
ncbi:MAG: hypothetical protein J6A11_01010 [Lachnospiraceae bacterium]|nr:hypothetical protein [Lachnospiraceae bacterium]